MDGNQILYRNDATEAECNAMLRKVYLWMCAALVITGLVAYYVSNSYMLLSYIYSSKWVLWTIVFGEFGLVIGLSAAINRISATAATLLFILYALLNGLLMSSIFMVYSISSIGTTFFVTAGTFGAMAIYGSVTKKDLTKLGSLLLMALIGLIIATLVNIFLKNTIMDMVISGIGVLVFVGLTAYDAQKIKGLLYGAVEDESTSKLAVLGALSLYLDFINLFLYLLRFLGRRK